MRISKTAVATLALAISLTACAGDDVTADLSEAADALGDAASEAIDDMDDMASEAMDDMDDMEMGSSDGERADEVVGATLREGDLALLDSAPAEFADAQGIAYLALLDGTTLTVDVDGLRPFTEVVGHLHAESCATSGGPHFKFDADGGDTPPNEVHIAATADDGGSLSVSVTNEMAATDAMSVVIHAADGDTAKALCADIAA